MPSRTRTKPEIIFQPSPESTAENAIARLAIAENGNIAYASQAFCSLANASFSTLVGTPASRLISFSELPHRPARITDVLTGHHKVFISGTPEALNFHFDWLKTPDGRRYLIGFENGENVGISREIMAGFLDSLPLPGPAPEKEERRTEHLSIEDMERLLDLSGQSMIIASDLGEILNANDAFLDFSGYGPENLAKLHLLDLFDPADRPYVRGYLDDIEKTENPCKPQDFEAAIVTRNGQTRRMEWRVRTEDHKLYCAGRDVTAIKTQQEALERRERQLSEAESIGRMGHWNWTIGRPEMEWSHEIFRIFGVAPESFVPGLEAMIRMVHRNDVARLNQAFQRALIEENDYDMEFRIIRPDGEIRHIRCEGRCARDAKGEVHALYGIMQDMTERLVYERQLREAKEASERAYAAKTQFLANMSHELRTPLNAIIGFSEMIERQLLGPVGTPKYLEYIGGIRESGEHLLDLISDILDMSKIEAGKYQLDLEEVQVGKVVKLALHMIEGRAHDAGVKIATDANLDQAPKIVADRRAVLQILLNILSNAVKFTGEGGRISLQCTNSERHVVVKISDNGIGIPATKLATITKPFEQVSSSYARNHEGSGLGLAITKELVEMHGGTLAIESALGVGTTVTVRLPFAATERKEKPRKTP